MTRCDAQGVPALVQSMRFDYTHYWFDVVYFDGRTAKVEPPLGFSLLSKHPNDILMFLSEALAESVWIKMKECE